MLNLQEQNITLTKGNIGLIADTHGLVRPEALKALQGVELIVHAGDIGKLAVLEALRGIAPVAAIRGNNDREPWAKELPDVLKLQIGSVVLGVIHDVNAMKAEVGQLLNAVVSGHSHKPSLIQRDGTLFINPGSAGPRRFKLPVAVGKLRIIHDKIHAQIVELTI
jgi:putative phosphoesterase